MPTSTQIYLDIETSFQPSTHSMLRISFTRMEWFFNVEYILHLFTSQIIVDQIL